MKPTITDLAKHISFTPVGVSKMKKNQPKKFELLWLGWLEYCRWENEKQKP